VSPATNRRILLIDDNASIHADYRKILGADSARPAPPSGALAAFFGQSAPASAPAPGAFELDSAYQGEEGLARAREALAQQRPYALAFVDVRMPPGIDGVETVRRLWELDPDVQAVICTAFADYTWEDMRAKLGCSDRLLILKKPFDPIEVVQLATALCGKWDSLQRERTSMAELRRAEVEARSYAASLSTFNRAIVTAKAGAESTSQAKSEFLGRLAAVLDESSAALLACLERASEPGRDAEQQRQSLESALARCDDLRRTARNLALQAGLELEGLTATHSRFSPGELIDGLASRWRARALARGLRLSSECRGALPATVLGDRALVEGILEALLDNALRYGGAGTVRLEASLPLVEEGVEQQIVYSVSDSGPGIPLLEQPRVFEPLLRDAGGPARAQGAHFSLHMARRLARFLEGELELESAPGQGCLLRLQLPAGDLSGVEFGLHPPGALPSAVNALSSEEARS